MSAAGTTGRMISSRIASRSSGVGIDSACCVEMTTVSTRTGLPSAYSTVTWLLPSGRSHSSVRFLRASARRSVSLCASVIGSGISSSVSRTARPNMSPWSPAPPVSTPIAMSGDCLSIVEITAHVS